MGILEYARAEVLCHPVDVIALDSGVLGEKAGSVCKEDPFSLLVVPPWKGGLCAGSNIQLQKHRPIVRSTQLTFCLSTDAPMRSSVQKAMSGVDVVCHRLE